MKTLLLHQPFRFDLHERCLPNIIPRNLLVVGTCLESAGYPVKIHDMQINRLGPDSISAAIREHQPDMVGVSIHAAPYIPATKACCEAIKAADPRMPIVTGGIFTSSYKQKIFDVIPELDIVVLNEAEDTVVEVAQALSQGRSLDTVPGIIYKDANGKPVTTAPRSMLSDLKKIPTPNYDLMDVRRYTRAGYLPPYIEAQRGCSFTCKFCGVHFPNRGNTVRYRDPLGVVDEIATLHEKYEFQQFFFSDDTFTLNNKFAAQICEEIIARGLNTKVRWTCYTRADRTTPEIARLMKRAGCYSVAMGVETGSHRDTKSINKGETISDYHKGIQMCKDAGLEVHSLVIFGFPEVSHLDIPMAAKFLLETKPTISQFFMFHPVPGTEHFDEAEKHGLHYRFEKLEDWYKNDFIEEPLCDTKYLTREDIIKYFINYNLAFNCYENLGDDPELQQRLLRNAIPRKKKEVVPVRTGRLALYSSPFKLGFKYADMFKNMRNLDEMQYEVLLRANGDFTIEEISERWAKLFDFEYQDALTYVVNALYRFERMELIHQLPALAEFNELLPEPYQPMDEEETARPVLSSNNGHAGSSDHAETSNGDFVPLGKVQQIPTVA